MTDYDLLKEEWKKDEAHALCGWDFSYINDRIQEEPLPWDYSEKVMAFLKPENKLLDMGTGGGEFLLSLRHPFELTSVTEGYKPNFELCMKRLYPLGIKVENVNGSESMPFDNNSFDIIINRHEDYSIDEIKRMLKPGGFFITQQVGGSNNRELSKRILPEYIPAVPAFNLENELPKFKTAGFRIMYKNQYFPMVKYFDIGALCWYMKIIEWEFPGFSVEKCFDKLLILNEEVKTRGYVESREHRFIIIAKNQK